MDKKPGEESYWKIKDSKIFLALCSPEYIKDPMCMMQLGMAVMLDKPILLPVPEGMKVPENLKRLAKKVVYYDGTPAGLEKVVKEMLVDERVETDS